ncbi:MAG: hypothetical protein IKO72_09130 [Kiritimatiellae bacterium]|nr:hypothetical protein [Kiritimatiellia bacterium]
MKTTFSLKAVCRVLALAAVSCVFAQESAENTAESAAEPAAEGEKPAAPVAAPARKEFRFLPLMRLSEVHGGIAQVLLPGESAWQDAVVGRHYPFGAEVRLVGDAAQSPTARFEIGPKAAILLVAPGSAFATREIAIGEKSRTVLLKKGTVGLDLPRSLKDGLITVAAADFACSNLAGESRFECGETAEGREVVVRVVTGSLSLQGRHYGIARMGAANQVRILTSPDALFTSLLGESGDYNVLLDCGVKSVLDPDTGSNKDVPQTIDYPLSPKCAVKIWRKVSEKAAGGSGRMAVAIQTFDAQGRDKNFRAFFEARSNVNTGELIVPPRDTAKEEAEKSKSAAEDVEEVAAPSTESSSAPAAEGGSSTESSSTEGTAAPAAEGTAAPAADSGDGL